MMMFDHGMPVMQRDAQGKPLLDATGRPRCAPPREQRAEADVNIECQSHLEAGQGRGETGLALSRGQRQIRHRLPGVIEKAVTVGG